MMNSSTVSTTVHTDTTTVTTVNVYQKRALSTPAPPGQAGTYPPAKLSSACSCLVTPSTVQLTTVVTGTPITSVKIVRIQTLLRISYVANRMIEHHPTHCHDYYHRSPDSNYSNIHSSKSPRNFLTSASTRTSPSKQQLPKSWASVTILN